MSAGQQHSCLQRSVRERRILTFLLITLWKETAPASETQEKDLLIAISFQYRESRVPILKLVLDNFLLEYKKLHPQVVVHTNTNATLYQLSYIGFDRSGSDLSILVQGNLNDPFDLAWMHREYFLDRIGEFRWFLYSEDDIYIPVGTFERYMHNFYLLWPQFVPAALRIEFKDGTPYLLDNNKPGCFFRQIKGITSKFAQFQNPYHAFWAMPAYALIDILNMTDGRPAYPRIAYSKLLHYHGKQKREHAAALLTFQLRVPALVEVEGQEIYKHALVVHLTNNYADSKHKMFSTMLLKNALSLSCK